MRQVLFYIPFTEIPIYGYGMMLFLAYIACSWLAGRLAKREGIDRRLLSDMAIWLFVTGIIGGRLGHVFVENPDMLKNPVRMLYLWDGGLVLYGALIGGTIGYIVFWRRTLVPANISFLKMADVAAPCLALGIALGRVGCLFTGCCYGNVACASCPSIEFPLPSAPTAEMARLGYEHAAGFGVSPGEGGVVVTAVEPRSPAAEAGVQVDDRIVMINGIDIRRDRKEQHDGKEIVLSPYDQFSSALFTGWPPAQRQLSLVILRGQAGEQVELAFTPSSLGLHPTQIYETISMCLLVFFLLSFFPYKQRDGMVLALFMVGYAMHRFVNEMLRMDNPPIFLGMTFSQVVSVLVLAGAGFVAWWAYRSRSEAAASPLPQPAVASW